MLRKADKIARLVKKRLFGSLTEAEQRELENWQNESATNQQLIDELHSNMPVEGYLKDYRMVNEEAGWKRIALGIQPGTKWKVSAGWLYAAVITALIALTMLVCYQKGSKHHSEGIARQIGPNDDTGMQFVQEDMGMVLRKIAVKYNTALDVPPVAENTELTGYMETTGIQSDNCIGLFIRRYED